MNNIVKRTFLTTMLSASLLASLAGCGKKNEKVETTEAVTTEAQVAEDEQLAVSDADARVYQKQEIVESTYGQYKEFYDQSKASKEDVKVMVDVINGDVEGYTKDQINDSLALAQYALLSDNTFQLLDNVNAVKNGFVIDSEMKVVYSPKVSDLIINSDNLDQIIKFEDLRDELVDEIVKTSTYSKKMANKITKATIDQEKGEYDNYEGDMDSSLNNEGIEYVIATAKYSLCNMAQMVNPNSSFISDKNDKYQLSPRSDVNSEGYIESDIMAQINQLERSGTQIPTDLLLKKADIENRLVGTKYFNDMCTLTDQLLTKAGIDKQISMIDLQKQKKELLMKKKSMLLEDSENTYTFTL